MSKQSRTKFITRYRVRHPEPGSGFLVEVKRKRTQPWQEMARVDSYDLALRIIMLETSGKGIYPLSELLGVPIPK